MESNIAWSAELTMRDFVDDFRYTLPVLCITRTGYSGYDEDIHQIGASEMYWIYEIQRQKRIVARQKTLANYISIPVDYPLKVQIVKDGKPAGRSVPVKDVLDLMEEEPLSIQFENDRSVSFQIGADIGSSMRFGCLEVEDSYEEKYLLAYTVHSGMIFSKTVGIPVYMDISLSVAEGLENGDKTAFQQWMREVSSITKAYESTPAKLCQEIILFTERPSSGEYEYIKPSFFASLKDATNEKQQQSVIGRKPSLENQVKPETDKNPANDYVRYPVRPKNVSRKAQVSAQLPAFPRRRPPPVPAADQVTPQPVSKLSATGGTVGVAASVQQKQQTVAGPKRPAEPKSHLLGDDNQRTVDLPSTKEVPKRPSASDAPLSPAQASPTHVRSVDKVSTASAIDSYEALGEVPTDFDVGALSIDGVSKLMTLMNVAEAAELLRKAQVDGVLLREMSKEMLVEEFGFSQFEAKKLVMFMREGWRPRI